MVVLGRPIDRRLNNTAERAGDRSSEGEWVSGPNASIPTGSTLTAPPVVRPKSLSRHEDHTTPCRSISSSSQNPSPTQSAFHSSPPQSPRRPPRSALRKQTSLDLIDVRNDHSASFSLLPHREMEPGSDQEIRMSAGESGSETQESPRKRRWLYWRQDRSAHQPSRTSLADWAMSELSTTTPKSSRSLWSYGRSQFGSSMPSLLIPSSSKAESTRSTGFNSNSPSTEPSFNRSQTVRVPYRRQASQRSDSSSAPSDRLESPEAFRSRGPASLEQQWHSPGSLYRNSQSQTDVSASTEKMHTGPRPPRRRIIPTSTASSPQVASPHEAWTTPRAERALSTYSEISDSQTPESTELPPLQRTDTFGVESGRAHEEESLPTKRAAISISPLYVPVKDESCPRPSIPERRTSLLDRLRKAFSPSSQSPPKTGAKKGSSSSFSNLSIRVPHGSGLKTSLSSTTNTLEALDEPKVPISAAMEREAPIDMRRHDAKQPTLASSTSRRSSWMSGSESWLSRLSRPEQEEEEVPVKAKSKKASRSSTPVVPTRSASLSSKARLNKSQAEVSPTIGLFSISSIDLTLNLPESPMLDLQDILDNSRRQRILRSLDHDTSSMSSSSAAPSLMPNSSSTTGSSDSRPLPLDPIDSINSNESDLQEPSTPKVRQQPSLDSAGSQHRFAESIGSWQFPQTPKTPSFFDDHHASTPHARSADLFPLPPIQNSPGSIASGMTGTTFHTAKEIPGL